MKWFSDFNLVIRSNLTTLREKFEHPERVIHQLVIDMEEELEHLRENVAETIADEILLAKRIKNARQAAATWQERAREAAQKQDEEAARAALEQKLLNDQRAEALTEEHTEQQKQTTLLQRSVSEMEMRIRQAQQKKALLLARMARAEARMKINQTVDQMNRPSAFAQFTRLEEKVERREAKTAAYDRMEGRDPEVEELEDRFRAEALKKQVQKEYDDLKTRLDEEAD